MLKTFEDKLKKDFEFKSNIDDSLQKYVQILPEDYDKCKQYDILLTLHGHGATRWQYINEPRSECKAARDFAFLHKMILISPDYRAETSWMGPLAESDMVQLILILRNHHKVHRIFIVGGSMGGTSALIFTALHPELIAGVCSQNGTANMLDFNNFQDAIAMSYGGNKSEKRDEYQKRSPELFPENFSMPIAFTVGEKDVVVPPISVRRLASQLSKNENKVMIIDDPNGGHATNYEDTFKSLEFIFKNTYKKTEII